ncbi:2Fe-2S iron-sulfur cluster-binding protein [Leucobacter allii]|uniref:2Fe-2S iron-sulfur cluster-binding protein n=1 Tax=Leucobacter allii TaxID=2932247 RepID=A0ABY4FMM1_9MICO|nr:2Fe-2S iron-sulfur cluster-binding protein [Leucobacter allii]UOQ57530.1 2Fe-2S iron-sulfur cluster-binding protein [Leucobacter allii]
MTEITFITPSDGAERPVSFAEGESVMQAAVNSDVPGIEGECGGEMNCGTCHVLVDASWRERFEAPSWDEDVMLDIVEREPGSRLGCQLKLQRAHAGLVVTVATGED